MHILDIFHYSFMIRALIAGLLIGGFAPMIGTFLVAKRYSLMADSLAHVSLTGVALGLLLGIYPVYTAILVAVAAALLIERLRSQHHIAGDLALAMFLSAGLAIATVLMSFGHGFNADLLSYLFGSITTVTATDVGILLGLSGVLVAIILAFYQQFLFLSFDEETAQIAGIPTQRLNTTLMILTAVTVSAAMRIVGVLLIGALMVIPVVTASRFHRSFLQTLVIAVGLSVLAVFLGLCTAFYFGLPAGGAIVVSSLGVFFLTLPLR